MDPNTWKVEDKAGGTRSETVQPASVHINSVPSAAGKEVILQTIKKRMKKRCHQCQFWLPKKKRFCANVPLPLSLFVSSIIIIIIIIISLCLYHFIGELTPIQLIYPILIVDRFCGNHTTRSDDKWVPCPIDPSHSVLEVNLEGHVKRCPLLKQAQTLSLQPYYQKGINRGLYFSALNEEKQQEEPDFTSEMKRNSVYSLTVGQLSDLLCKIRTIHNSIWEEIGYSYKVPEACNMWIKRQVDGKLPYQEKHVLQQASILGNLEDLGVLNSSDQSLAEERCDHPISHCVGNDSPAVVEFGAGRGYLTQILADCYGIKKVFLVERKSYKLKADRSLRQKESLVLERLRIDIEDLNLNGVESLKGIPYLAIGKHLCGPATDLTLRCCLGEHYDQVNGTELCVHQDLRGIAVATCCHHLCQWKHYTNKQYLLNLGITKEDFHAITWFTSWAVDADHGSDLSDDSCLQSPMLPGDNDGDDGCARGVEEIIRNMKAVDRAAVGFMCKDIIDIGRLMWVKERGLEAKLVKYVPSTISPENRLLVARH